MASLSSDSEVERFLSNFQQLSHERQEETMERMSSLEKEVEEKRRQYERSPKKKKVPPIVPKKKAILGEVVKPVNDVEDKNEAICLVQPKAREDDLRSPKIERESGADQLARLVDSVNYGAKYEVPKRNPHEPKPIKYEDVMKVKVWDSRSEPTNSKVKEKPSTEKSPVPVNRSKPIIITPRSHTNPNAKVLTSYHREPVAPSLSKNPPRKPLRSEPYPETVEVRVAKIKVKPTVAPKPKPASSPEFLSKFKSLQPAPVLAKPEEKIPEALVRRNHLNRPKVGPKPIIGVPEAVSRRNNLNKPKDVPRPEQRIPEALERLQTLRKQGVRKTGSDREHSTAKEKTSYQNMGPIALPGMVRTSLSLPVPLQQTHVGRYPHGCKSVDTSELDKEGRPLRHLTKTRARGPKRRPPKVVDRANSKPSPKYGSIRQPLQKEPPPIRKSSRKVSTGELFI